MMEFEVVSTQKECRELWEKFSSKGILWDLWDYRICFHDENFRFNFILGIEDNSNVGLLPLVYDRKECYYTYFGGEFPEQNKFFLNDKALLPQFLERCPKGTEILYIDSEESSYYDFQPVEKRYFLNLKKHGSSFDRFIGSFTKKHRKNIRYDLKKLQERNYKILHNAMHAYETFVELSKKRFGKESNYHDENFAISMGKLVSTAEKMKLLDIISVEIGKVMEAVGLGVIYNRCYYVVGVARNTDIKNLGKLLIAEHIKSAIAHNCDEIDFLSTESKWKELWNLDSEQMYSFVC